MRNSILRLIFVGYVLVFGNWLLVLGSATGQTAAHKSAADTRCHAGAINFTCPKGFVTIPVESDLGLALLFQKKYDLGIFVAAPPESFDEQTFLRNVTTTAIGKFFAKENQTFTWKPSEDFANRHISKYELAGKMSKGYNGKSAVIMNIRHLKMTGKEVFIGYISISSRGSEAKEFFNGDDSTDNMSGCNASVEIVFSITGEKLKEGGLGCTLGEFSK